MIHSATAAGKLFGGDINAVGQNADQLNGNRLVLSDKAKELVFIEFQDRHFLDRANGCGTRCIDQKGDFTNDFLGFYIAKLDCLGFVGRQPDFTAPGNHDKGRIPRVALFDQNLAAFEGQTRAGKGKQLDHAGVKAGKQRNGPKQPDFLFDAAIICIRCGFV